jgi:hypothetical protein
LTSPTITPGPASSITGTGATLYAAVNPNGQSTKVYFQYSTSPTFTPTVQATIGSGFNQPYGVAVDGSGDVFVADWGNNAVKEVLPSGAIQAIGSGFNEPTGVAVDGVGDVFVADSGNNAVKELSPSTVPATPSPLTGTSWQAVSATLTGLTPGTSYYYRAGASSAGGMVAGTANSFTA